MIFRLRLQILMKPSEPTRFIQNGAIRLFLSVLLGLSMNGCAMINQPEEDNYFYPVSRPEDFPREITRVEKLTRYHPDPAVRAKSHLRLAMLYLDYRNPHPDYLRALKELKQYVSMSPDGDKRDEAQTLIILLSAYENVLVENDERGRANELLTEQNRALIRENRAFKETINELKYLDLQLEEKRRQVR
jgi:hypothetical protein